MTLHPKMALTAHLLREDCRKTVGLETLAPYETVRTPQRQSELYSIGRTKPGRQVTHQDAWGSFHQYGLAVDFVSWDAGTWTWWPWEDERWKIFHDLANARGLRTLSTERPHVEWPWALTDLHQGIYPPGSSYSWRHWVDEQIETWGGRTPHAPPLSVERPPLETA